MLTRSESLLTRRSSRLVAVLTASVLFAVLCEPASALIQGGKGNKPVRDPGWPAGAEPIFNHPARVAWWEGPPFGGGRYHAECRGDTESFNKVLAQFAKLRVKNKRLVLHDGIGQSFWLNPNRKPENDPEARINWMFTVWIPDSWNHHRTAPADFNPTDPKDAKTGPPATIELYTGGAVRWAKLKVPKGITVVDNRLESHGFTPADGSVAEGAVLDNATNSPIAAIVRFEQVEVVDKGRRTYKTISKRTADKKGHWVVKNVPAGTQRVTLESDGYVPRIVGYFSSYDRPRWQSFDSGLSRAATVSGHVADSADKPLAGVEVKLHDVASGPDGRYESKLGYSTETDANGQFRIENVPAGTASIRVRKQGYCRPGLSPSIKTPSKDVALRMTKSARLEVTVEFSTTERPEEYIVNIEEEGGPKIGSWGGSAHIDKKNQKVFENIPPGTYFIEGHPNPTTESQRTDRVKVKLEGGKTHKVSLTAR